ncbi:Uncharacterised protein [Mycobacterium tuberculosis]|uniref:Uncharacterized protein n=1 Tax=Mycobacterium tuberculosis TaxID=1773 RepID=A0A916P770_MYCTX|nr:Uncharacterised protein [Mycobacterium tuberculosis]COX23617.1 Uncharacterised protein [Mycobacterium tuberculosis]COX26406.1 Uncharacterised protein [Mycobacterium tuberculosis]COZ09171.1 Uncharacterised protein [Mycobacterium tuberculosis]COZ36887.1 Uncharacterised protein [Mycobacterium tuberculosis]
MAFSNFTSVRVLAPRASRSSLLVSFVSRKTSRPVMYSSVSPKSRRIWAWSSFGFL